MISIEYTLRRRQCAFKLKADEWCDHPHLKTRPFPHPGVPGSHHFGQEHSFAEGVNLSNCILIIFSGLVVLARIIIRLKIIRLVAVDDLLSVFRW